MSSSRNIPHIRKSEPNYTREFELWHCSYRHSDSNYWHTFGKTWQVAYDKMVALSHRALGAYEHEPLIARHDL